MSYSVIQILCNLRTLNFHFVLQKYMPYFLGIFQRQEKILDAGKVNIKVNCMLHKTEVLMKLISCLPRSDDSVENSHISFKWQMHLILSVCFNSLGATVGWGICLITTRQIVSCNSQSPAMTCETFWHFVMSDFTYCYTWWWCAGSWGAAACIRGFSSHGRQTWRMGLFPPCTLSPGTGQISPCCPVRESEICDLATKVLFIEVKLRNHRCGLSWHILTLKAAKCDAAMHT